MKGELRKLKIDYDNILKDLMLKLTSINIYILKLCINHNVQSAVKNVTKTYEKTLRNLTKQLLLPITYNYHLLLMKQLKISEVIN